MENKIKDLHQTLLTVCNKRKIIHYSVGKMCKKSSWCKGKRVTAVSVWRPLTKKSIGSQRYGISYWWLIVTMDKLFTICEIFSHTEVAYMLSC